MSHAACFTGGMQKTRPHEEVNPDHHIWNNNGTWWCHFTIHKPDHTKHRVRVSLSTKDRVIARSRRDLLLRAVPGIARAIPQAGTGREVKPLPRRQRLLQPEFAV